MSSEFSGYEYGFGTIRGLRSFQVDQQGRLRGVTFPAIWKPGLNESRCGLTTDGGGFSHPTKVIADGNVKDGRCDNPDHGCGFWAYHDGSTYTSGSVHAVIEGSGKVTVGTRGFRCERAEIVALCIPNSKRDQWVKPKASKLAWWWVAVFVVNIIGATSGLMRGHVWLPVADFVFAGVSAALAFAGLLTVPKGCRHPIADRIFGCTCKTSTYSFMPDSPRLSSEQEAKLRRNYPDLKFYDSLKAMKADYPVDPALEPSPENDPTFWDDTPTTGSGVASIQASLNAAFAQLNTFSPRRGGQS